MDKSSYNSTKETISSKLNQGKDKFATVYKFRLPGCNFSRAERFSPRRFSLSGEFTTIPNTIGTGRKTSFGFGRRHVFHNPGGKDAPPCNLYNITSCFDDKIKRTASPRVRTAFNNQRANENQCVSPSRLRISINRTRYSTDVSSCLMSAERHCTPGPRKSV
ncbi:hypothetical protein SteCoe_14171 [Stentor coeruleus]|uniref:Uncharacterized protein n=1 Tax=Stentor coeruleus TaxID=5963 RepID=A0A1R2C6K1_9CILI|nr:hypothetical protein SteCoe_14171 [Stentor coeruleus]